jgi:hypothetical protein
MQFLKDIFEISSTSPIAINLLILLIIVGIALFLILIGLFIIGFWQGRPISIWPPRIEAKPATLDVDEIKTNNENISVFQANKDPLNALAKNGCTNVFRIPSDNSRRLEQVCELIDLEVKHGHRKLRLTASSGYSYLDPHGPVWKAKLGKLVTRGDVSIFVILESPFSQFAMTRALANKVAYHHWEDRQGPNHMIELLQYPNVTLRVTNETVNCSLFFSSQAVYYDPYLWALPHSGGRTENNFFVFEFQKVANPSQGCYGLLEKHFEFIAHNSIPLEELLHEPSAGSVLPRGLDFFNFFKRDALSALNLYNRKNDEFHRYAQERLAGIK